jgi:multidrug transporter EmrE-like cation transporter
MKLKIRKGRTTLGFTTISLVCFNGFIFLEAWLAHAPSTVRHGIYFGLSVIVAVVAGFILFERDRPADSPPLESDQK